MIIINDSLSIIYVKPHSLALTWKGCISDPSGCRWKPSHSWSASSDWTFGGLVCFCSLSLKGSVPSWWHFNKLADNASHSFAACTCMLSRLMSETALVVYSMLFLFHLCYILLVVWGSSHSHAVSTHMHFFSVGTARDWFWVSTVRSQGFFVAWASA